MSMRMTGPRARIATIAAAMAAAVATAVAQQQAPPSKDDSDSFRFRSAVELINVTTTVTDASGRFVPNLRQEDFRVFEDGKEQPITHFSRERVPVSLGIAVDTSNSMEGEKMEAARDALSRFLVDLLERDDEVFLYRFSTVPELVEGWTTNRERLQSRLRRLVPDGGTAMYDAVADAVPLVERGRNRKKALLIISDGNDTNSGTTVAEVKRQIRASEVIVYAIGIDGQPRNVLGGGQGSPLPPTTFPFPFPMPRRAPSAPPLAEAARHGRQSRRARERRGAARHHRRQRRPHRDRAQPARPRSRNGEHRQRAESAVFPWLSVHGQDRRPLAHDRRRSAGLRLSGQGKERVRGDAIGLLSASCVASRSRFQPVHVHG